MRLFDPTVSDELTDMYYSQYRPLETHNIDVEQIYDFLVIFFSIIEKFMRTLFCNETMELNDFIFRLLRCPGVR